MLKKINVPLFAVGFLLVMAFFIPAAFFPQATTDVINAIYAYMTRDLAWVSFAGYLVFLLLPI